MDVKTLTEKLQNRNMEAQPGRTMVETFETEVMLCRVTRPLGSSARVRALNRTCACIVAMQVKLRGRGDGLRIDETRKL